MKPWVTEAAFVGGMAIASAGLWLEFGAAYSLMFFGSAFALAAFIRGN